jgi:RNA:NAD 2'-phosphotransferase (TPT1/KptA family)
MGRSFVHLHADKQKAIDIAKRHGDTDIVLFQVDAEDFRSSGVYFAKKDLGYGEIFLASEVHPKYLHEIDE